MNTPPVDTANSGQLYQYLRDLHSTVQKLEAKIASLEADAGKVSSTVDQPIIDIPAIRDSLQAHGDTPLNLTGLLGKTGEPQLSAPVTATALATLPTAASYPKGTFAVTTNAPYTVYFVDVDSNGVHRWTALVGVPSNMVTTDTAQTITGAKNFTARVYVNVADIWLDAGQYINFNTGGIGAARYAIDAAGAALNFFAGSDTARMGISSAGNVGIGVAPGTRSIVEIKGATPFLTTDGTYGITFFGNTLNFNYDQNADGDGWINYAGYLDGATKYRDLIIGDGKNNQVAKFTASTKSMSLGGVVLSLNGDTLNGNGVPAILYRTYNIGLTASVGATTMYTTVGDGDYRIMYNVITTTVGAAGSQVQFNGLWTDANGARTATSVVLNLTGLNILTGSFFFRAIGNNTIKWSTTWATGGTYAVATTLERLS